MSARLDRNALKVDLPAARGAWDAMRALMQVVTAYQSALDGIDFSPVPVTGATIDLFYKVPQLKPTLLTARQRAGGWTSVGMGIEQHVRIDAMMFGYTLKGVTDSITATVNSAAAQGRAVTQAERTSMLAQLQQLAGKLQQSSTEIAKLQPAIVDFIRTIKDDAQPLDHGATDLGDAIETIQKTATNEALKYMKPDTMGVYQLILDWGGKILARLRVLQAALQPLGAANERSRQSVQGILTIWETVTQKYKAVVEVLATTQTSIDDYVLLPDLLEIATLSWKDVTDYMFAPTSIIPEP